LRAFFTHFDRHTFSKSLESLINNFMAVKAGKKYPRNYFRVPQLFFNVPQLFLTPPQLFLEPSQLFAGSNVGNQRNA